MAERNLQVIKMNEVEKKVKIGLWRQKIGYGSSDFACNLIWQMISLYLLYFYTNVMHLNAGAVSVMFLVTKVAMDWNFRPDRRIPDPQDKHQMG